MLLLTVLLLTGCAAAPEETTVPSTTETVSVTTQAPETIPEETEPPVITADQLAKNSLEELLKINPLLKDIKAVKDGNVWCTAQNMYQETVQLGQMTREIHQIIIGTQAELEYLYLLR